MITKFAWRTSVVLCCMRKPSNVVIRFVVWRRGMEVGIWGGGLQRQVPSHPEDDQVKRTKVEGMFLEDEESLVVPAGPLLSVRKL